MRKCLELLPQDKDRDIRTKLADALLAQLDPAGIEPVRQMVQKRAYDDSVLDLSGRLVALATDQGFLARDAVRGFAWLGLLAAAVVAGAWGNRKIYPRLGSIVEPFRDELVARTVAGALRRSTAPGAAPDTAGVARLTISISSSALAASANSGRPTR